MDGELHAPAALPPGKRPGTHCTGDWVGPKAGMDGCEKSRPPMLGFDPLPVQPVGKSVILLNPYQMTGDIRVISFNLVKRKTYIMYHQL